MGKLHAFLAVSALILAAGCNASGTGDMVIQNDRYFDTGAGDIFTPHTNAHDPHLGTYLTEIEIDADADKHSAEFKLKIPSCISTYYQTIDNFSCRDLGGGWKRCTGTEQESWKVGPVQFTVDLKGKDVVRAWIWELRPSSQRVYTEQESANRGPKLIAYFGNHDYPSAQQWPRPQTASNDLRPADANRLREALTTLGHDAAGTPSEAVHSGASRRHGEGAGESDTPVRPTSGNASI